MPALPTSGWDQVPVHVWLSQAPGVPEDGYLDFEIKGAPNGVRRADGLEVYRRPLIRRAIIGEESAQEAQVRTLIREAYRARDEAAALAAGQTFNAVQWGVDWDARLPSLVCTSFYAPDDTDITPQGWEVWVTENLRGEVRQYPIPLTLASLGNEIPGINLGEIELPPGTPIQPAPSYAKGQPNGLAPLGADGKIELEFIPDGIGGASDFDDLTGVPLSFPTTVANITDATAIGKDLLKLANAAALGASHTHTAAQIADFVEAAQDAIAALLAGTNGVSLSYNDAANTLTITGSGAATDPEAVRDLIGLALLGAGLINITVNDALDTITISTTATQNSTDAQLRDRTTHTGVNPVNAAPSYMRIGKVAYTAGALPAGSGDVTMWHVTGAPADDSPVPSWIPAGVEVLMFRSGS